MDLVKYSLVEYNNKNLPIDPYVLGLWLGDGVSESGTIVMLEDDFENIRFDKWFKKKIKPLPQAVIERSLRKGKILVNEKKVKSSYKIKINDEIINYKYSTKNSFKECTRSFSGITSYRSEIKDQLIFETSLSSEHKVGDNVYNISSLFLKEFFKKYKYQFAPGFEGIDLYESIKFRFLFFEFFIK